MAKLSPNAHCPCGSGLKYKKCCRRYHKGALPKDALTLMKSRYSAYAAGESGYIVETTHPENPDFSAESDALRASIEAFCRDTGFLKLEIIEFVDGEEEAFVTFTATLDSGVLKERSRFRKVDGKWLYLDALFL